VLRHGCTRWAKPSMQLRVRASIAHAASDSRMFTMHELHAAWVCRDVPLLTWKSLKVGRSHRRHSPSSIPWQVHSLEMRWLWRIGASTYCYETLLDAAAQLKLPSHEPL
jgi:hypothetical protein